MPCDALLQQCRSIISEEKKGKGGQHPQLATFAEHPHDQEFASQDAEATQLCDLPPTLEAVRVAKKAKISHVSVRLLQPCMSHSRSLDLDQDTFESTKQRWSIINKADKYES